MSKAKKYGKPCPRCGKMIDYRPKLCWDCTWEVRKVYCIDCGKVIKARQKRCWECHKKHVANPECCIDCGKQIRDAKRCMDCRHKYVTETAKKWHCIDCGTLVNRGTKRCKQCNSKFKSAYLSFKRTDEQKRRLSKALKGKPKPWLRGRKHSAETRRKMREYWTDELKEEASQRWTGENNPGYIHGNGRRVYPREFNGRLRTQIRKRDGYICQFCHIEFVPRSKHLSVHHIDYDKRNNDTTNLISLCKSCHAKTNFQRQEWQAFFCDLQVLRERTGFPHPSNLPEDDIPRSPLVD